MSDTENPAKRQRLSTEPETSNVEQQDEDTLQPSLNHDDVEANAEEELVYKKSDKGKGRAVDPEEDAEAIQATEEQPAGSDSKKKQKFVPVHGNYRGYYTKRRFHQDPYRGDERLELLKREWLADKRVLDIGCNMGKRFGAYRVTGVDIDGELIRRATRQARIAWSAQEPLSTVTAAAQAERERQRQHRRRSPSRSPPPVQASEAIAPSAGHFPEALSRMFGYLPNLPSDKLLKQYVIPTEEERQERSQRSGGRKSMGHVMPKEVSLFPHNIHFKKADWVNTQIKSDKRGYDCILALSVSKWIHLNQGDDGLIEFFTRVFMTLLPKGRFVFEAQPWSSYAKAARMSDSLKESYNTIKLRPDDFERILLEEIGFESVEKLTEESGEGFKRPLHVYYKAAGSWL